MIALDMDTGKLVWSVQTTDPTLRYMITGEPRVIDGKVIIGNGVAIWAYVASSPPTCF